MVAVVARCVYVLSTYINMISWSHSCTPAHRQPTHSGLPEQERERERENARLREIYIVYIYEKYR